MGKVSVNLYKYCTHASGVSEPSDFGVELAKECESLMGILAFYAKEENWPDNPCLSKNSPKTERDQGQMARDWLDRNVKDWREL